ncbi:MAG TPA: glycosyltransferase family 87 protein, partial [Tepidiformaceae bacterium]|nr:glycosyltransferase family 87 protein [Tepidiformaceae bacterium]
MAESGGSRARGFLKALGIIVTAGWAAASWWQPIAVFLGRRSDRWDLADFATLYAAGKLVLEGNGGRIYHPEYLVRTQVSVSNAIAGDGLAYLNPPFFAWMLSPLARMSSDSAFQAWTVLNLAALAACAAVVWRMSSSEARTTRILLTGGVVCAYPVTFALRLGQFSLVLLLCWTMAYVFLSGARDRWAGVALAGLLIKPELLIPVTILLTWKRRWGALATLLPLTGVLAVFSVWVVGIEEALRLPGFILENSGDPERGTRVDIMYGWNGLFGPLVGEGQPHAAALLALPFLVVSTGVLYVAWRGPMRGGPALAGPWLVLTLYAVLADPNMYLQDTV